MGEEFTGYKALSCKPITCTTISCEPWRGIGLSEWSVSVWRKIDVPSVVHLNGWPAE